MDFATIGFQSLLTRKLSIMKNPKMTTFEGLLPIISIKALFSTTEPGREQLDQQMKSQSQYEEGNIPEVRMIFTPIHQNP